MPDGIQMNTYSMVMTVEDDQLYGCDCVSNQQSLQSRRDTHYIKYLNVYVKQS